VADSGSRAELQRRTRKTYTFARANKKPDAVDTE
jgi:hypothetical protein